MYLVAIGWLYVALLAAVSDTTVLGGILSFVFYGVAPLALVLWLLGTPARRRRQAAAAGDNDRTDPTPDQ
jgi:membrane protein implicated in regulation of membrane protease activity